MRGTISLAAAFFTVALTVMPAGGESTLDSVAADIHNQVLVIDTHIDIPLDYARAEHADPGAYDTNLKFNLQSAADGGYGCAFLITYTPQGALHSDATAGVRVRFADNRLDGIDRMLEEYSNHVAKAVSPDDVLRINSGGRIAIAIGMENGYPLGDDLSLLQHYYDRGVRYITLTHNGHNLIADSANPPNRAYPSGDYTPRDARLLHDLYVAEARAAGPPSPRHDGLSAFGRKLIAEMNRLGMMVDISHTSPATVADVLAESRAPVIASHSSGRALCDNPRNLSDSQLRAIAATGGVVQVTAVPDFVSCPAGKHEAQLAALENLGVLEAGYDSLLAMFENNRQAYYKIAVRYQESIREIDSQYPAPGLSEFVDHIDHVVSVAGIEHVGVGSDFDGGGGVEGFNSAADARALTTELVRRGYTGQQIGLIWGGNLMRVWREVEAAARRLAKN